MRIFPLLLALTGLPTAALANAAHDDTLAPRPEEVLRTTEHAIDSLATDGRNLYWREAIGDEAWVMALPKTGGKARRIARAGEEEGLAVDDKSIYLPRGGALVAIPKGGGMERRLAEGVRRPRFALDDRYLYWVDEGGARELTRVRKQGGAATVLARLPDGAGDLACDGQRVYWSLRGSLYAISREGGEALKVMRGLPIDVSSFERTCWIERRGDRYLILSR